MPTTTNYNTTPDGRPTASYRWEQQFFDSGHRGPPPKGHLEARIEQLEAAITKATKEGRKPQNGWLRELDWRKRQLQVHELDRPVDSGTAGEDHPKGG